MIIGFAGKAASGKTTAAKFLLQQQGLVIEVLPMARALRDEVEDFIRQVGAADKVPLVYGDQADKVRIFYIDQARAGKCCPQWEDFIQVNGDIQDRPGCAAVTVRRLLQWWGTEYRRAQDPDYWTKAWERNLAKYDLATTHILVDDVRFSNELAVISKHGGVFVRIERPGFHGANDHSSENSLDHVQDWDLVIHNDGSLAEFKEQITAQVLPLFRF